MKCIVLIVLVCAAALHAYPAPEEEERSIDEVKSDMAGEDGSAVNAAFEKVIGDLAGEVLSTVLASPESAPGSATEEVKGGTIAIVPIVVEALKKGMEAIGDLFGKLFG